MPIASLGPYSQPAQAYAMAFLAPITLGDCSKLTVTKQLPRRHHPWLFPAAYHPCSSLGFQLLVKSNWKGVTSQTYNCFIRKAVTKLCSGLPGPLLKVFLLLLFGGTLTTSSCSNSFQGGFKCQGKATDLGRNQPNHNREHRGT